MELLQVDVNSAEFGLSSTCIGILDEMTGGLLGGCARPIAFPPCVNPYLRGDSMEIFSSWQ